MLILLPCSLPCCELQLSGSAPGSPRAPAGRPHRVSLAIPQGMQQILLFQAPQVPFTAIPRVTVQSDTSLRSLKHH